MKVAVVLGTRPEIIKMVPIIRELEKKNVNYFIIHSGQHYSYNMDKVFFNQFNIATPKYKLEVGSHLSLEQIALIISGVGKILQKEKPSITLVQGDTNTVFAGGFASKKSNVLVGHVEAGLRSYDEKMPEETNRRLTDHLSDFLFAPTNLAKNTLLHENIPRRKIHVTGNTIVDSVNQSIEYTRELNTLEKLRIEPKKYFLLSLHRQENVDDFKIFKKIIFSLRRIKKEFGFQIVFPIHPRTKKMAKKFQIKLDDFKLIEPQNYFNFLKLQSNAKIILTDSGGVQEEACILKVPCITIRETTERPETVKIKANFVVGSDYEKLRVAVTKMLKSNRNWKNPYGDGNAAQRIVKIIC